jgi:hypothetical protein
VRAPLELRQAFVSVMSESAVATAEITLLARHFSSRTTVTTYRCELRPVIATGVGVLDKTFI